MQTGIMVKTLYFKGQDERGLTGEIEVDNRQGPFLLIYRKAGSKSGNHYHQGISANKNPERLYLLQGEMQLSWAKVNEQNQLEEISELKVESPAELAIESGYWHEITFLSDSILLELNSFKDGDRDTFKIAQKT